MNLSEIKAHLEAKDEEASSLREELQEVRRLLATLQNRVDTAEGRLRQYVGEDVIAVPHTPLQAQLVNNGKLKDYIRDVLQNSNEPLTTKEIADLVKDAGYITSSRDNFVNIVGMACVKCDEFRRVTKGNVRPVKFALANDDDK